MDVVRHEECDSSSYLGGVGVHAINISVYCALFSAMSHTGSSVLFVFQGWASTPGTHVCRAQLASAGQYHSVLGTHEIPPLVF